MNEWKICNEVGLMNSTGISYNCLLMLMLNIKMHKLFRFNGIFRIDSFFLIVGKRPVMISLKRTILLYNKT